MLLYLNLGKYSSTSPSSELANYGSLFLLLRKNYCLLNRDVFNDEGGYEMSSRSDRVKDIAMDAAATAAIIELIGAARIGLLWLMDPEVASKQKAYVRNKLESIAYYHTKTIGAQMMNI